MTPTLFQSLLGVSFYALPPSVRVLHEIRGRGRYIGRASITRGRNPLARLCAALARLPPAMQDVPAMVDFDTKAASETWTRHFGDPVGRVHRMRSRLRLRDRLLVERLGPMQFRFSVCVHEEAIHWHVEGARLFGLLPLPASWFSKVTCREGEDAGRYTFFVDAAMPLIGSLVRYEGWLEREADAAAILSNPASAGVVVRSEAALSGQA